MTIQSATETGHLASHQDGVTKKLKGIVLAVLVVALLIGAAGMTFQPQLGLLGGALLFGWTQLVGL